MSKHNFSVKYFLAGDKIKIHWFNFAVYEIEPMLPENMMLGIEDVSYRKDNSNEGLEIVVRLARGIHKAEASLNFNKDELKFNDKIPCKIIVMYSMRKIKEYNLAMYDLFSAGGEFIIDY